MPDHAEFAPPCARYEGGENDQGLLSVWTYVAGLLGGGSQSKAVAEQIARLYDFKGELIVATRSEISDDDQELFRQAWRDVGCEPYYNVHFLDVFEDEWQSIWRMRRFESDWAP